MAERFPIFTAKGDGRQIGYIEGNEAFDLLGRRRCSYNENSGNLCDDTGQIVGHVSLKGKFVGASWIADELFPKPDAASFAPPADSPGEHVAPDPTKISSLSDHDAMKRAVEAVRTADEPRPKPDTTSFAAPTNSLGKPIPPDPIETFSLSERDPVERALAAVRIAEEVHPKSDVTSFDALTNSLGKPIPPDPTETSSLSAHDPVERALAAVRIAEEVHPKSDVTSFDALTDTLEKPIPPDETETSSLSDHDALERALEAVRDVVQITKTGNRYDPISKKIVSHSSFELGASWITDEQFPKPDATSFAALTSAPSELIACDPIETSSISDHDPVERAIEVIRILDKSLYAKSDATTFASANSPGEPISSDPAESSSPLDDDPIELALKALQIAWARRSKKP